jgi:NitT/TauT family transport system substrate-binding protein
VRRGRPLRALAVAVLLTAALAVGRNAGADTLATVRVGVGQDSITMTPIYLAEKLGYFHDEGLSVDLIPFQSAALMVAPLGTGQLDVGGGAVSAGLYNAVSRGIDVRIVADLGSDPPGYGFQTLVVRNSLIASGGFKSLKDLKGKSLAITGRGISTTALAAALMKKAGLTLADVHLVYLGVADQIAALQNGSLDASLMPEPGPTIAQKQGVATKIIQDDAYYPNQALVVLLYGTNLVTAHRDLGVRFMRAYLKAVRLYNNNLKHGKIVGLQSETVMTIFADRTHQDRSVLDHITPSGDDPDGRLNVTSLRSDFDFFRSEGLIESPTQAADSAVDASFASDAVTQLGPYRR